MYFYLFYFWNSMTSYIKLMVNCIWGQVLQWLEVIIRTFTFALAAQNPLPTISWHSALPTCFFGDQYTDNWHRQKFKRPLSLFTIAKLCNQLKCPSSRDCIRKMKDNCTEGFYLAIRKKLKYVIWAKMERNIPYGVKQTQLNILWVFSPM